MIDHKAVCGTFWAPGDNLNIRLKQSQSHRRWKNFCNFQQMFKSQERLGMQKHRKFVSQEKVKEKQEHASTLLISRFRQRQF